MTKSVWHETDYVVPSPVPKLSLSQTPKGILVQYDAEYERNGNIERRAYLLEPNLTRQTHGTPPIFINPSKAGPQTAIPILAHLPIDKPPPDIYAVCSTNLTTFTIYRHGAVLGPCDLPVCKDHQLTAARLALTPLAVVADASIVGGVIYCAAQGDGQIWPLSYSDHSGFSDSPR